MYLVISGVEERGFTGQVLRQRVKQPPSSLSPLTFRQKPLPPYPSLFCISFVT